MALPSDGYGVPSGWSSAAAPEDAWGRVRLGLRARLARDRSERSLIEAAQGGSGGGPGGSVPPPLAESPPGGLSGRPRPARRPRTSPRRPSLGDQVAGSLRSAPPFVPLAASDRRQPGDRLEPGPRLREEVSVGSEPVPRSPRSRETPAPDRAGDRLLARPLAPEQPRRGRPSLPARLHAGRDLLDAGFPAGNRRLAPSPGARSARRRIEEGASDAASREDRLRR